MLRIRLGRVVLRTWRPWAMWLPAGYRTPQTAYLVECHDERDHNTGQLGAFTSLADAERCIAVLTLDGWKDLTINMVPVHERLKDWEHDR